MTRRAACAALFLLLSRTADAQCPDGSPPPCAQRRVPPAPPAPDVRARHFVLLPFRNVTRKPEQDWLVAGAPLMLGQILGQFRDLDVVPEERLTAARRKIGLEADAPLLAYGLAAGVLWGEIFGYRREFSSFAAALMSVPDLHEVPVLRRDTLELVPRSEFDSLPAAERTRLRRRSADVAWEWVERWLLAGPDDAEAHLWAARIAEARADYDRALQELHVADSLGIQSVLENRAGWRPSGRAASRRHGYRQRAPEGRRG